MIFLQHISTACYAERCSSYSKLVRLPICLSQAGMSKWLKIRSCGLHWRIASWL